MAAWPPTLPDQTGRVVIVTGANTGIGLVTAQELARAGARVHMACRSLDRGQEAADRIRADVPGADLELWELDLDSLAGVRASAEEFLARDEPLHLLVNNAGLVSDGLTSDGFARTFGINHLGTAFFTQLLLDRLRRSAPARIVTVASRAHMRAKGIEFDRMRTATTRAGAFGEYCESKLANVLFSAELARRLAGTGVTTYSVHPGVVATDVWRRVWPGLRHLMKWFMISPEDGARTSLYCATAPELADVSGRYYADVAERAPRGRGRDDALAAELWARTEEWLAGA
jgi:retinol dehydrogenase-12